ncbi:hypothetical protein C9397_12895 [Xanthomonas vasicola pv. vasculorum]|uniref:Uncharacterized protein n=1 Tax=Xanthomonas vasicola pv. vasculorum TaxID=325776 RepID=A0AAE8F5L2_XANVA|nr:hypothetical protein C7V42_09410 [Xanthomonas vasicola pv. vasculorum]AZR26908.1 hypothetical protein NX80_010935 [Xanthomonas vasicola pv. arecae]AZR31304.1 hypothetical protein KWO_013010 [Xanthomonas vasicola pv. musacearum NCPPB 4379]AZR34631.1 hypothetical protein NX08_009210 [Xanthomonas vasicola]RRJ41427.1 hypothetical protein EIM46_08645 [Xanthomonas vasicola pv. musacearum]
MEDACTHLQPLCAQARRAGCTVRQVSHTWSQARRVLEFAHPMPAALPKQSRADAAVVYHHAPAVPHWPGDEGFFCERCLVGLMFPLR